MGVVDLVETFYEALLNNDPDNKANWVLNRNGMCNTESRNPDECFSLWIVIRRNFVDIVAQIQANEEDRCNECANDLKEYITENSIDGLVRLDNTIDPIHYRSKNRSRWCTSKEYTESPVDCIDWAIKEYYKYLKLLANF